MDQRYIIEPIEFAFTNDLFKGLSEAISQKVIVINNVDDAYKYAFEQNLPSGYKVWNDTIEQCRKSLRKIRSSKRLMILLMVILKVYRLKMHHHLLSLERRE
ncbi:hypothetical protein [Serratia fonticola]|uniref:hypothetical protein n=1 Tax=Serratia fonticola TaxID=47917 RepID=UPI001F35919D|nr:hypothetical protein [Serratia fonticola]